MHRWEQKQMNDMRQRLSLLPTSFRVWILMIKSGNHCRRSTAPMEAGDRVQSDPSSQGVRGRSTMKTYRQLLFGCCSTDSCCLQHRIRTYGQLLPPTSHTVKMWSGFIIENMHITSNRKQKEAGEKILQALLHDDLELTNVCSQCMPHPHHNGFLRLPIHQSFMPNGMGMCCCSTTMYAIYQPEQPRSLAMQGFTVFSQPHYLLDLSPSAEPYLTGCSQWQNFNYLGRMHANDRVRCTNIPTVWFTKALRYVRAKWQKCTNLAGD